LHSTERTGHLDTPVEKLAELLLSELPRDELEPELRRYPQEIDYFARVLEYCIENEPDQILGKLFGAPKLRKLAISLGCEDLETAEKETLIESILRRLNFNVPPSLVGIRRTREELDRVIRNIRSNTPKQACAETARAYVEVERVLADIVVFYVSFGWSLAESEPESISRILMKSLDAPRPLNRLGFGDFVGVIRSYNRLLSKEPGLREKFIRAFQRDFVLSANQMKVLDELAPLRKLYTHAKGRIPSLEECDRALAHMSVLTGELLESSIYPVLIRVLEVTTNKYGVQYVRAEDEFGGKWIIYTSRSLDPSKSHLMHSMTNPVAISPPLCHQLYPLT